MEWLRVVDLAEYSPNLRGSGVHGALMMYEPRFTAELLADLLSIPPSKTLLRRHLCTHFKELLGRDVIQQKREAENTLGFQPLTLTAKIKVIIHTTAISHMFGHYYCAHAFFVFSDLTDAEKITIHPEAKEKH